jgi:hypothetical protein
MTVAGVLAGGGTVERLTDAWHLRWADGQDEKVVFRRDQAKSGRHLATLGDPHVAAVLAEATSGEVVGPLLQVELRGMGTLQSGLWSLWLVGAHLGTRHERRAMPVFLDSQGAALPATARAVWERLMEPSAELHVVGHGLEGVGGPLAVSRLEAERLAGGMFASLQNALTERVESERTRYLEYAERRRLMIERIGLENVRRRRLSELDAEREQELGKMPVLEVTPELRCIAAFEVMA